MSPARRPSVHEILRDRTLVLMLMLGFGSGLPFLLILGTQAARLAEAKISIETITKISWVAFAYALKFLWAPLIDRFDAPLLTGRLGRRRAWLLVAQVGVMIGLLGLAFADPAVSLAWVICCAAFTGFAGATQDIVVDGWRIDVAPPERQGVMAATGNFGYRLALICAGAGALYLADFGGWRQAYVAMALLMLIPIAGGLMTPRLPDRGETAPRKGSSVLLLPAARLRRRVRWLPFRIALVVAFFAPPIIDLFRRKGRWLFVILLLVALYRLPDFLTGVVANPLYIQLGFSKTEIATMSKVYGVWIGIAGAFAGGFAITRLGLMPALLIGGITAAASHLCLALLAASGKSIALLGLSVSVENFAGNFAGAALIAYMSSLTSPAFAASQYALLSSLYALLGKFLAGFSGDAVKDLGFPTFFVASSSIGIPVTVLCLLVWRHKRHTDAMERAGLAGPVGKLPGSG